MKKLITITSLTCLAIFGLASCTTVENPNPTTTSSTTTTRESTMTPATQQTTTTRSSGY